jgi:hypothetical protein
MPTNRATLAMMGSFSSYLCIREFFLRERVLETLVRLALFRDVPGKRSRFRSADETPPAGEALGLHFLR